MFPRLCLLGVIAAVGCSNATTPTTTGPSATNPSAAVGTAYAILVPNMT